jgi:hypothetical protein
LNQPWFKPHNESTGWEAIKGRLEEMTPEAPVRPEKPFGVKLVAFLVVLALSAAAVGAGLLMLATGIHFWKLWV